MEEGRRRKEGGHVMEGRKEDDEGWKKGRKVMQEGRKEVREGNKGRI